MGQSTYGGGGHEDVWKVAREATFLVGAHCEQLALVVHNARAGTFMVGVEQAKANVNALSREDASMSLFLRAGRATRVAGRGLSLLRFRTSVVCSTM